jgi:hypothetical protein
MTGLKQDDPIAKKLKEYQQFFEKNQENYGRAFRILIDGHKTKLREEKKIKAA